jgi:F-type H+-transporting ATPase subunit b
VLIDWFTVIAQVVNFLVLVLLLRWLLYRPVLRIMRQRQEAIEAEWSSARQQQAAARQSEDHFRRQSQELEQLRSERLAAMHAELAEEKQQLLQGLRSDLSQQRREWQEQLQQEIASSQTALSQTLARQVIRAVRQLLSQVAGAELETQLVAAFADRLSQLDPASLAPGLGGDAAPLAAEVRTSFELSATQQQQLQALLLQRLPGPLTVTFALAPDLLCGLELRLPGQTIGWTLAQDLQGLQDRLLSGLAAPGAGRFPSLPRHDQPTPPAGGCH